MSQKRATAPANVTGEWTLRVGDCEELSALNLLNITNEGDTGSLTGYVCRTNDLQKGSIDSASLVNFNVVIGGITYAFAGVLDEGNPSTMKGRVSSCQDGEEGTWSATAQTTIPNLPD